jgi:hypothetical protein
MHVVKRSVATEGCTRVSATSQGDANRSAVRSEMQPSDAPMRLSTSKRLPDRLFAICVSTAS